jgi:sigma-B regulation protein RsbU (phosphoserine phosphatase)
MKVKAAKPSSSKNGGGARVHSFWNEVTDRLEMMELWRQFKSEAREGYGLYSRDVDWTRVETKRGLGRYWMMGWLLFRAMLMKLTPARRLLLLVALFFVLSNSSIYGKDARIETAPLGGLILLVLLALELADRVTMKRDLEIARAVQRRLLPAEPPEVPGFDLAFAMRAQNTVAGDYYDAIFPLPSDAQRDGPRLLVAIADVAGKSMPAALLMATFQASLDTLLAAGASMEEVALGLNRYTSAHSMGGMRFTTAFLAEIDVTSLQTRYVNAGHNAPILLRASGEIERLSDGGVPFGIFADRGHPCIAVTLAHGDRLVMFTDGVVEAEDENNDEYGEARLLSQVKNGAADNAKNLVQRIMADVDRFAGAARQHDDITCFALRVL